MSINNSSGAGKVYISVYMYILFCVRNFGRNIHILLGEGGRDIYRGRVYIFREDCVYILLVEEYIYVVGGYIYIVREDCVYIYWWRDIYACIGRGIYIVRCSIIYYVSGVGVWLWSKDVPSSM